MKNKGLLPIIVAYILSSILMFYTVGVGKQLIMYVVLFPVILLIILGIIKTIKKK